MTPKRPSSIRVLAKSFHLLAVCWLVCVCWLWVAQIPLQFPRFGTPPESYAVSTLIARAVPTAAFAVSYGPLHYLLVHHIVAALGAARHRTSTLVDLGCGTGAAGAACAGSFSARLVGIDRHPWALAEAAWTYALFGLRARTRQG